MLCLFFAGSANPRILHSFPTQRSSELANERRPWATRLPATGAGNLDDSAASSLGAGLGLIGLGWLLARRMRRAGDADRKSTRSNSRQPNISYARFCL